VLHVLGSDDLHRAPAEHDVRRLLHALSRRRPLPQGREKPCVTRSRPCTI
jgi:hypothetical protein